MTNQQQGREIDDKSNNVGQQQHGNLPAAVAADTIADGTFVASLKQLHGSSMIIGPEREALRPDAWRDTLLGYWLWKSLLLLLQICYKLTDAEGQV
jgi:hypothetical protein